MSLAIQGEGSSERPIKRRHGCPSNDLLLNHAAAAVGSPESGGVKQYLSHSSDTKHGTDAILGQSVTGFIEATFDGGYLLNVRIGGSSTSLRGLVFKPGYYVPITAANDVAPHLPMIQRSDISFYPGNLGMFQGREHAFPEASAMLTSKTKYASRKDAVASAPHSAGGSAVFSFGVQSPTSVSTGIGNNMTMADPTLAPHHCAPASTMMGQQHKGQPSAAEGIHMPDPPKLQDAKSEMKKEPFNVVNAANSVVLTVQENPKRNEPLESQAQASSSTPAMNHVAGRMSELLEAMEESTMESSSVKPPGSC